MYNSFEYFLATIGCSWTAAKFIPYFLTICIGLLMFRFISKMQIRNWLRLLLMALGFCLPFISYFVFYPIYRADLQVETYKPLVVATGLPKQTTLFVVILPGCPYCIETIELSKKLLQQNPKLNMRYILSSDDQEGYRYFRKRLPLQIGVEIPKDQTIWMLSASGEFPSFLLVRNKRVLKAWHNNDLGVRALDQINAYF